MVNIIKEELPIEESLRKKLELICDFAKVNLLLLMEVLEKLIRLI